MTTKPHIEMCLDSALAQWDAEHAAPMKDRPARRAMFAAWWFVENVPDEIEGQSDVFFRVREIVREAGEPPAVNPVAEAVAALNEAAGPNYWILAKGRDEPSEPLYAAAVYAGNPGNTVPLVQCQHNELEAAIAICTRELSKRGAA